MKVSAIMPIASLLAVIAGSATAGSFGTYPFPLEHDNEPSGYNKCIKKPGVDEWECTTCYSSEIRQESICVTTITNNPGPQSP